MSSSNGVVTDAKLNRRQREKAVNNLLALYGLRIVRDGHWSSIFRGQLCLGRVETNSRIERWTSLVTAFAKKAESYGVDFETCRTVTGRWGGALPTLKEIKELEARVAARFFGSPRPRFVPWPGDSPGRRAPSEAKRTDVAEETAKPVPARPSFAAIPGRQRELRARLRAGK